MMAETQTHIQSGRKVSDHLIWRSMHNVWRVLKIVTVYKHFEFISLNLTRETVSILNRVSFAINDSSQSIRNRVNETLDYSEGNLLQCFLNRFPE